MLTGTRSSQSLRTSTDNVVVISADGAKLVVKYSTKCSIMFSCRRLWWLRLEARQALKHLEYEGRSDRLRQSRGASTVDRLTVLTSLVSSMTQGWSYRCCLTFSVIHHNMTVCSCYCTIQYNTIQYSFIWAWQKSSSTVSG